MLSLQAVMTDSCYSLETVYRSANFLIFCRKVVKYAATVSVPLLINSSHRANVTLNVFKIENKRKRKAVLLKECSGFIGVTMALENRIPTNPGIKELGKKANVTKVNFVEWIDRAFICGMVVILHLI